MRITTKILYVIVIVYVVLSFAVTSLIKPEIFLIILALAAAAALLELPTKLLIPVIVGTGMAKLIFLKIIPLPYTYLSNHGMSIGIGTFITLVTAFFYIAVAVFLAQKISSIWTKSRKPKD